MRSKGKNGTCVKCGYVGGLTFEHIPPIGTGMNKPAKLFNAADVIGNNEKLPWDFEGRSYLNAQRGTGGYYLCSECNNQAGIDYVPDYIHFMRELKRQNVQTSYFSNAKEMRWQLTLKGIRPLNIAKQIMLMHCCVNGRIFTTNNAEVEEFINDKEYRLKKGNNGYYAYINSGAMSVTYALTGLLHGLGSQKSETTMVTGVASGTVSFQLELGSKRNISNYTDISSWFSNYAYNQIADIKLSIPVKETNMPLPNSHRSKQEIHKTIMDNRKYYK